MFDASKIGQSFPPYTIEVERGKIGELALAVGDPNPIYQSRQAAQAAGYADVPLYPTTPTTFIFWGFGYPQFLEHWASLGIDADRVLHGEESFEYLAPIKVGDTLTGIMTLVEARTTKGQAGSSLDILTLEFRYTNQYGEPVLRLRKVIIVPN
ncbi:MAG TPA: MaoC family dehydratase N-terminal domain-containing protein [Ktedonobacteraceae bacterium]|nr:MaoC family dehydratase N-terminal domain-containing protein [Ktedonobacteraceae bacterium]